MDIVKKLKELDQRLTTIENKRGGQRLQEMAKWIDHLFKEKNKRISVKTIYKLGKQKGYSWQMLQRARRELLDDKIVPWVWKEHGWYWTNYKKVLDVIR